MEGETKAQNLSTEEKRALLAKLLSERARQSRALPLSYAQQRLFFVEQVAPGSSLYNIPFAIRIEGTLPLETLQCTLDAIIARHESLRTTFACGDEEPRQIIAPTARITISQFDLTDASACSLEEREVRLERLLVEEANKPFDLARDLMIRAALFRLSAAEHVLLVNMHHIASDEWSLRVFFREFATLFETFAAGRNPALPELPIQYSDFAQWQRKVLHGEMLDRQLAYWKQQLAGKLQPLELPANHPRPKTRSYRGATESSPLARELQSAANQLARRENVTEFMLLLAAFKALLWRYTGREELLVGTPIAGRTRPETEDLIGFFVNTLVLRTSCGGDPSFRTLLARVRDTALGAYANHELPFEKIVEALQPQRTSSHTPLVNIMFALQNAGVERLEIPGLRLTVHNIRSTTSKFDLTFVVRETGGSLITEAEYSTDLFEPGSICRLLDNFKIVLQTALADPEVRLSALPVVLPQGAGADLRAELSSSRESRQESSPETTICVVNAERAGEPHLLHRQLQEIWQDVLGRKSIGLQDNFFDIGGHSLLAMRLFAQMEKKLRRKIPLALLFQAPTIEELAREICASNRPRTTPLLVEIQPGGSRPPIFWLHNLGGGGGGGLFVYRKLAQLLGPDQPSFGVTAPTEPFNRIEIMAAHYIEAIRSMQPIGPYYLGGYCFGGVVAFEMARQLKVQGHQVALVAALESSLPGSAINTSRFTPAFVGHVIGNVPAVMGDFFHHSPQEMLQRIRRKAHALSKKASHVFHRSEHGQKKSSNEVLDELIDMSNYPKNYKDTARIHFDALMNYHPQVYAGRIHLFRTSKPPLFDWKPEVLWNKVVTGGVDVKIIPGAHENILEDPYVETLAARVRECLAENQPRDLRVRAA